MQTMSIKLKIKDQLAVTCYFISLLMRSTCFRHQYVHHQELMTILLNYHIGHVFCKDGRFSISVRLWYVVVCIWCDQLRWIVVVGSAFLLILNVTGVFCFVIVVFSCAWYVLLVDWQCFVNVLWNKIASQVGLLFSTINDARSNKYKYQLWLIIYCAQWYNINKKIIVHGDTTVLIIHLSIPDMFWTLNDHLQEWHILNSRRSFLHVWHLFTYIKLWYV